MSYSTVVSADSPALWYRTNESEGTTAADSSGHSRTGTYGAGVTLGQTSLLTNEPGNKSILLSGTSTGRITTTYNPFAAGSTRTFEGWARRSSSAAQDTLMGSDTASAGNQVIVVVETGAPAKMKFVAAATGSAEVSWEGAWPGNEQNVHWVIVYNDSTKKATLWINGESKGEKTLANGYAGSPGNFVAGVWSSTFQNPWHGKQDEIAVYEGALSEARIKAHYEAGTAEPEKASSGSQFFLSSRNRIVNP